MKNTTAVSQCISLLTGTEQVNLSQTRSCSVLQRSLSNRCLPSSHYGYSEDNIYYSYSPMAYSHCWRVCHRTCWHMHLCCYSNMHSKIIPAGWWINTDSAFSPETTCILPQIISVCCETTCILPQINSKTFIFQIDKCILVLCILFLLYKCILCKPSSILVKMYTL